MYYVDLNRNVEKEFYDGIWTFISIASTTSFSSELDWIEPGSQSGERPIDLAIHRGQSISLGIDNEDVYSQREKLVDDIIIRNILSNKSKKYITELSMDGYSDYEFASMHNEISFKKSILEKYIRRFINSIYSSSLGDCYLIISEAEIEIISDICQSIIDGKIQTDLPFPNLTGKLIDPNNFAHGILNFSPVDLWSIQRIREDKEIRKYASRIHDILADTPPDKSDHRLTDELIKAHTQTNLTKKINKVFEIGSWVVKPLQYVPVAGQIVTVANDISDIAKKGINKKSQDHKWHLIGVRMKQISIEDYLQRLSNNEYPALLKYRS